MPLPALTSDRFGQVSGNENPIPLATFPVEEPSERGEESARKVPASCSFKVPDGDKEAGEEGMQGATAVKCPAKPGDPEVTAGYPVSPSDPRPKNPKCARTSAWKRRRVQPALSSGQKAQASSPNGRTPGGHLQAGSSATACPRRCFLRGASQPRHSTVPQMFFPVIQGTQTVVLPSERQPQ